MSYAIQGTIASPSGRRSLPRLRAALSVRRARGLLGPVSRTPAGDGAGPIATGASRGVALFVGR